MKQNNVPEWVKYIIPAVIASITGLQIGYKVGNAVGREELAKELLTYDGTIHDHTLDEFFENAKFHPFM